MLSAPRGFIRVRFSSFRANLSRTSCAGGILRLWALYEHVLRRLLRPHSREGESARGFEASSAVTGCFLLRAVFVEAVKMRRTGERETK